MDSEKGVRDDYQIKSTVMCECEKLATREFEINIAVKCQCGKWMQNTDDIYATEQKHWRCDCGMGVEVPTHAQLQRYHVAEVARLMKKLEAERAEARAEIERWKRVARQATKGKKLFNAATDNIDDWERACGTEEPRKRARRLYGAFISQVAQDEIRGALINSSGKEIGTTIVREMLDGISMPNTFKHRKALAGLIFDICAEAETGGAGEIMFECVRCEKIVPYGRTAIIGRKDILEIVCDDCAVLDVKEKS